MSVSIVLAAVGDLLRGSSNIAFHLGPPRDGDAGLFVWPYRLAIAVQARSPEVRFGPTQAHNVAVEIPLIVVAHPPYAPDHLDAIEAAIRHVLANPVLSLPTGRADVSVDTRLTTAEASALFAAAGVAPTLSLQLVVRTSLAL